MPTAKPLHRYLPIAFLMVICLSALIVSHPAALFRLLDPVETLERVQERAMYAIGSREAPLTVEEARALLEKFRKGNSAASVALVRQEERNGLPDAFVTELETALLESGRSEPSLLNLISRLATHRPFGESMERGCVDILRSRTGAAHATLEALGRIGRHRPLAESTLKLLLELGSTSSSEARNALGALRGTAEEHGLPDWVLDRLERIAREQRGPIRSDALEVIAASGAKDRALALFNVETPYPVDPTAVASALPAGDLRRLLDILKRDDYTDDLRVGALHQIVRRRDQSETVGDALTFAFLSDHEPIVLAAFSSYADWGRHHSRFIQVAWPEVCASAFDQENPSIRMHAAGIFRFVPFMDLTHRDDFLMEMLHGTNRQQVSAIGAIRSLGEVPEPIKRAVSELAGSENPDVAQAAAVLREQYRSRDPLERLGSSLAGALFWSLLFLPGLTAVSFETYFVARLLQGIGTGARRLGLVLVSVVWLGLCVALGMTLLMGVLGLGHGGRLSFGVYAVLLAINAVFGSIGWLFWWMIRGSRAKRRA